jgi:prevent-host-death family protein
VSEFKAHCLRMLDDVSKGGELVITRHGKDIARVTPATIQPHDEEGSLRHVVHVVGDVVHSDWSEEFEALRDSKR